MRILARPFRPYAQRESIRRSPGNMPASRFHKIDQCARRADDAADPRDRARFVSERRQWLRILADDIGADVSVLEATIALLPRVESG
jgi:hypothetical protein